MTRQVISLARYIAIAAALAGALLFGISAIAEQHGTKHVESRPGLSPRLLLDLVRQPVWVLGVGGLIAGFVLQVVALHFGSLALVEPILVGDLVFAVLIGAYQYRSRDPAVFAGVAACIVGVAGFLAVARPSGGRPDDGLRTFVPLAAGYGVLLASCLMVAPVLAIITSSDPLMAILLAGLLLNERLADSPAAIAGEVVSLILMTAGVVVIAQRSPQATPPVPSPSRSPGSVSP